MSAAIPTTGPCASMIVPECSAAQRLSVVALWVAEAGVATEALRISVGAERVLVDLGGYGRPPVLVNADWDALVASRRLDLTRFDEERRPGGGLLRHAAGVLAGGIPLQITTRVYPVGGAP